MLLTSSSMSLRPAGSRPAAGSSSTSMEGCIASTPEEVKTLNDYLQQRAKKTDRNEKQGTHYVIIAASRKLAERSTVIPQLYRPDFCDNMTVVTLYDQKQYLPKECRFVVELHDAYTASLLDYDDVTGHVQYCDSYVSCFDFVLCIYSSGIARNFTYDESKICLVRIISDTAVNSSCFESLSCGDSAADDFYHYSSPFFFYII